MNPFKFGTIVENDFFTDRVRELEEVKQKLNSENHLVLISPRRFGKSSLIQKALVQMGRPALTIDMMNVLSVEGFAAMNRTDRYVMLDLARENKRDTSKHVPTSTVYSSLQRLAKKGYVIKSDTYEIEDPFFRKWILEENA